MCYHLYIWDHVTFTTGLCPQNDPGPGNAKWEWKAQSHQWCTLDEGWQLLSIGWGVAPLFSTQPNWLPCLMLTTGLIVQYTNDNGITWHLLRELDFMSYLEPQVVSIDLPREAKTSATAFRWWQPQHGTQHHPTAPFIKCLYQPRTISTSQYGHVLQKPLVTENTLRWTVWMLCVFRPSLVMIQTWFSSVAPESVDLPEYKVTWHVRWPTHCISLFVQFGGRSINWPWTCL